MKVAFAVSLHQNSVSYLLVGFFIAFAFSVFISAQQIGFTILSVGKLSISFTILKSCVIGAMLQLLSIPGTGPSNVFPTLRGGNLFPFSPSDFEISEC